MLQNDIYLRGTFSDRHEIVILQYCSNNTVTNMEHQCRSTLLYLVSKNSHHDLLFVSTCTDLKQIQFALEMLIIDSQQADCSMCDILRIILIDLLFHPKEY